MQQLARSASLRLAKSCKKGISDTPPAQATRSVSSLQADSPKFELLSDALCVHAPRHGINKATFSYIFLRDACTSSSSIDPFSRQKLFCTSDIPQSIRPATFRLIEEDSPTAKIVIEWNEPLRGRCDDQPDRSQFELRYLARYQSPKSRHMWHRDNEIMPKIWDCKTLDVQHGWFEYEDLSDAKVLLRAMRHLLRFGIAFIRRMPTSRTSDEDCELNHLSAMLGDIRRTWYGDKSWSVKSIPSARNIAYTNLDLGLHMDLLHYEHPPRFQLLHCLQAHSSLRGGTSYFVDAYKAASNLRNAEVRLFNTLATLPVAFEYRNGGHWRHAKRTTFDVDVDGNLRAVYYSPPFQAPLPLYKTADISSLHTALSAFASEIARADLQHRVQLQVGDCVVFDNLRVLHARTAFTWDEEAVARCGGVGRHLKGSYIEGDSVRDRYRMLREIVSADQPDSQC